MINNNNNNKTNPEVRKMMELNFEGNIIPAQWYKHITFPSGKTNLNAVVILAEIVYWYRPAIERDPATGKVLGYRQKFKGDKLQRSYQSFADQFGLTKRQVQDAVKRLIELGLVRIEFRNIKTETGLTLTNVMYIEPVTEKIKEITYGTLNEIIKETELNDNNIFYNDFKEEINDTNNKENEKDISCNTSYDKTEDTLQKIDATTQRNTSYDRTWEGVHPNVTPQTLQRGTNTENTMENTTEIFSKRSLQQTNIRKSIKREKLSSRDSISSTRYINFILFFKPYNRLYKLNIKPISGLYKMFNKLSKYMDITKENNVYNTLNERGINNFSVLNAYNVHSGLRKSSTDMKINVYKLVNKPVDKVGMPSDKQNSSALNVENISENSNVSDFAAKHDKSMVSILPKNNKNTHNNTHNFSDSDKTVSNKLNKNAKAGKERTNTNALIIMHPAAKEKNNFGKIANQSDSSQIKYQQGNIDSS
ncbi:MAG TPA: hypothetical protein GXX15_09025 [Clostridia bacterium]|nr:hypothetical protein [Clostridia bacterium]